MGNTRRSIKENSTLKWLCFCAAWLADLVEEKGGSTREMFCEVGEKRRRPVQTDHTLFIGDLWKRRMKSQMRLGLGCIDQQVMVFGL